MFASNFICLLSSSDNIFVSYYKKFIQTEESVKIFNLLEQNLVYNSEKDSQITIMGKKMNIPRKQVAYGDTGTSYKFSGVTVNAKDWNDDNEVCKILRYLRDKIAKRFNFSPNFVLINRYENGDQYIGPHSDDEKDLAKFPNIAGISFGAGRDMLFEHKYKNIKKSLHLTNGSAYCMHYPTNTYYKHSIPKKKGVNMPRISLTFRQMNV